MKKLINLAIQLSGSLIVILIVITLHYSWQLTRSAQSHLILPVYCVSFVILLVAGYLILYRMADRSYGRHYRLNPSSLFCLCLVWGAFFAFPSLFRPYNWAWSFSDRLTGISLFRYLSILFILTGLLGVIGSILWLGIARSTGSSADILKTSGVYRISRNPQVVAGGFIVSGYALLWPVWYSLGWLILFCILAHLMVISEEKHLARRYGKEYVSYCQRTHRYIGWHQKQT